MPQNGGHKVDSRHVYVQVYEYRYNIIWYNVYSINIDTYIRYMIIPMIDMNMITSYDYTNIDIRSTVYNICVSLYLVVVLLVDLIHGQICARFQAEVFHPFCGDLGFGKPGSSAKPVAREAWTQIPGFPSKEKTKEHKWEIQLGDFFQQIYHWRDYVQIWEVQFMVNKYNKWPVVWVGVYKWVNDYAARKQRLERHCSDPKSTAMAESGWKPRLRSSGTISLGRKTASDLASQWAVGTPYWVIWRYLYYICNIEHLTHRKCIYIHGGLDKHVLPLVVGIWHSSKWVKPSKFASW